MLENNQEKYRHIKEILNAGLFISLVFILAGCKMVAPLDIGQTYYEGYIITQKDPFSIPIRSSQDHVLLTLGTPSVTTTHDHDHEIFYYISQTRYRVSRFMKPRITDRHVVAIYFDHNKQVSKTANYGLENGKIFDFVSKTTPAGESNDLFLKKLFKGTQFSPFSLNSTM